MKAIKIYFATAFLMLTMTRCNLGDFGDTNVSPKSPTKAEPAFLVNYATLTLANCIASPKISRLLPQYWSMTLYTPDSRFHGFDNGIASENYWGALYGDVLPNLKVARELVHRFESTLSDKETKLAQITVLEVYAFQQVVDAFGDIPYTDAIKGSNVITPAYDRAEYIYHDLITKLTAAIKSLQRNQQSKGFNDLLYQGDLRLWLRFANSLLIKIAMRVSDVAEFNAQQLVEQHYAHAFTSSSDNAILNYPGGSWANPLYTALVLSGRPPDYGPSNTLVDYMNELRDPRRSLYMKPLPTNEFSGIPYGLLGSSDPSQYSALPDRIMSETYYSTFMDYTEVLFYLAECAEKGWNVGHTSMEYYHLAVTNSILDWGGSTTDVTNYLNTTSVAYPTAEGGDHLHAIAKQKWLALYNRGWEAWAEWRRLDYPVLNAPENMQLSDIPVRFTYPESEQRVNATQWMMAANGMGGDHSYHKIFWDIH